MKPNEELLLLAGILESFLHTQGWGRTYGGGKTPREQDHKFCALEWSEDRTRVAICLYDYLEYQGILNQWCWSEDSKANTTPGKPLICCLMAITMAPDSMAFEINSALHELHKKEFKALFERLGFSVRENDFSQENLPFQVRRAPFPATLFDSGVS